MSHAIVLALGPIFFVMLLGYLVFPVPAEIAKVSILLAALPPGFFGILFGVNYKLDSAQAGSMVIASTVFSIVSLAVVIALLYPQ